MRPAFARIPWRSTFKPTLTCAQRVICRALPNKRPHISLHESLLALARVCGYVRHTTQACRHSSIHACIHAACSPHACACKCACACAYTLSSEEHQPETRRRPEVAGLDPRPRLSVLAPLVTLPADSPASTEAPCRRPPPSPAPATSWRSCVATVAGAGAAPWPPCILPMARVL